MAYGTPDPSRPCAHCGSANSSHTMIAKQDFFTGPPQAGVIVPVVLKSSSRKRRLGAME
jgi:hypothetical protein